MKKIFLFAAIAVTAFTTSCLMSEEGGINGEKQPVVTGESVTSLTLKVSLPNSSNTRADEAAATVGGTSISDGYIYIIRDAASTGTIVKAVAIDATMASQLTTGVVDLGITSGVLLTDNVIIIANLPTGSTGWDTVATLGDLKAKVSDASTQTTFSKVAMANTGFTPADIEAYPNQAEDEQKEAFVEVNILPVISRIEIKGVTATGDIKSYKLSGIFLDKQYTEFSYDGTGSTAYTLPAVSSLPAFDDSTPANNTGYGFDVLNVTKTYASTAADLAAVPDNGRWAYNVPAVASGSDLPVINVRVESVTTSNANKTAAQLMTVTTFKDSTSGDEIEEFKPGYIYTINAIVFSEKNLILDANTTTKLTLTATVTVGEWDALSTDADLLGDGYQIKTLVAVGGTSAPGMATFVFDPAGVQPKDKPITLTATPATGYEFDSPVWTLSGGMESQSIDITTGTLSYTNPDHNNWTATANVKKLKYAVTTLHETGDPEVIIKDADDNTLTSPVEHGQVITLVATPTNASWQFDGWDVDNLANITTGDIAGDSNTGSTLTGSTTDFTTISFTMPLNDQGVIVKAKYTAIGQLLTVSSFSNGTVKINGQAVTSAHIAPNTEVTLTATPSSNYYTRWDTTDITPEYLTGDTYTFTMPNSPVTVTPSFVSYVPNPVGEVLVGSIYWAKTSVSIAGQFVVDDKTAGAVVGSNATPLSCPVGWQLPTTIQYTELNTAALSWQDDNATITGGFRAAVTTNGTIYFVMVYGDETFCTFATSESSSSWARTRPTYVSSDGFEVRINDGTNRKDSKQSRCVRPL